jgi:hypothetical protein
MGARAAAVFPAVILAHHHLASGHAKEHNVSGTRNVGAKHP